MEKGAKVPLYSDEKLRKKVGTITVNTLLTTSKAAAKGIYLGIAKRRNGDYVIIKTTATAELNHAYVINKKYAFEYIVYSGFFNLLDEPKYADLKPYYKKYLQDLAKQNEGV